METLIPRTQYWQQKKKPCKLRHTLWNSFALIQLVGHQFANELIISPKMGSKGANLLSKKSLKSREAIKSPLIDHH